MNNIEFSLMAIVLNYPEKIKEIRNNIFLQAKAKKLYDILIMKKDFNKAIIIDLIQTDNSFELEDFEEIYNYYYEIDQFKNYYDYVLANYLRFFFYDNAQRMLKMKELSSFEIKQRIQNLINESSIDEEKEIICCQEVLKEMLAAENQEQVCKLVTSDVSYFDQWGGFESDDYIIIAARANVGKSTTAINMINVNLKNNKRVGFFSLETNRKKIMSIMSCAAAGVEELKYRTQCLSNAEKERLYHAWGLLYEKKLFIDDTYGIDIEQMKRKFRIMKNKYDIDIGYVDYIQLIKCYEYNTIREKIICISHAMKQLARELQIPIVCLAQLNRENEKEKREPRKSDLKESGSLEEDSDIIILLHPENPDDEKVRIKNIVSKGRNIPTGFYYTYYEKKIRRITELKGNYA